MNKGEKALSIMVNYSKAFDTVDYFILLNKIWEELIEANDGLPK